MCRKKNPTTTITNPDEITEEQMKTHVHYPILLDKRKRMTVFYVSAFIWICIGVGYLAYEWTSSNQNMEICEDARGKVTGYSAILFGSCLFTCCDNLFRASGYFSDCKKIRERIESDLKEQRQAQPTKPIPLTSPISSKRPSLVIHV
jgi:hypothetical protein